MLARMKTFVTAAGFGVCLLLLAGCPEKKPEGDGAAAATKPAASAPGPGAAPAPAAPAKGGGW
jgi:hypothetical protein